MSFTYTRDIPFENNNPSNDQPNMKTNTNSIDNLLQIDHVSFNQVTSGQHLHVTFPTSQSVPTLSTGATQIYPRQFGSGTTYLETYTSSLPSAGTQINGYLPFVKCMGKFTPVAGPYPQVLAPIADTLNVNIASITQDPGNTFTIQFSNALPYNTYFLFFDFPNINLGAGSVTKNTTDLVLVSSNFIIGTTYGFMVI